MIKCNKMIKSEKSDVCNTCSADDLEVVLKL